MFNSITSLVNKSFKNKEVRNRIVFTILMILLIRFLDSVLIPGLNPGKVLNIFATNDTLTLAQSISGGSSSGSILTLGLSSYISASIIIQLLQTVIKRLDDLSKEGQRGRMILNQITRYLTLPITLLQASLIWFTIFITQSKSANSLLSGIVINPDSAMGNLIAILSITAGTMLLMWIAEEISQRGIGQGSTIVIIVGILNRLPSAFGIDFSNLLSTPDGIVNIAFLVLGFLALLAISVFISESVRKVLIQYASRVRSVADTTISAPKSFFPIKLSMVGVMPVIFASMLLSIPNIASTAVLSNITDQSRKLFQVSLFLRDYIYNTGSLSSVINYSLIEIVLIIGFTIFTTFIYFKPKEISDNLQKSGAFVPGIKPGKQTEVYLKSIITKLSVVGGLVIALIVILPNFVSFWMPGTGNNTLSLIGGTSLIILVSGALEIYRQMNSYIVNKSYDKYSSYN